VPGRPPRPARPVARIGACDDPRRLLLGAWRCQEPGTAGSLLIAPGRRQWRLQEVPGSQPRPDEGARGPEWRSLAAPEAQHSRHYLGFRP